MGLERITYFREKQNMSLEELSIKSGVPVGTLSKISAGITKNPRLETIRSITEALNCTLDDLDDIQLTYSVEEKDIINMYRDTDNYGRDVIYMVSKHEYERSIKQNEQQELTKNVKNSIDTISVITYDLPASAGTGAFLDGDSYEHIEYSADDVPYGTDFAVRIQGDSMEPDYHDGGIAFVRKDQINNGDIGIFVLNGEGYIKQLEQKKNNVYLVSLNPKYKPIKILESDSIFCVGKVLN